MLENFKGAIFDMDGTLIDSVLFWNIIWKKFGEKYLNDPTFKPSTEVDKAIRTMTLMGAAEHIHKSCGIGSSGKELFDILNETVKDFYGNEVELKKGVSEFLEYCYSKGIRMCIASATDIKLIKIAVEHCKIGKYFTSIFSCAEIGKGKDQPDIYLKALDYLGTGIDGTYVFEDSHIAINTANKLGMKTVGIYDKYNYEHEEMKKIATVYIDDGETLQKLIQPFELYI